MTAKHSFTLSRQFLDEDETAVFNDFLSGKDLDSTIWNIFRGLFDSATDRTTPYVLRVSDEKGLCGAAVIIRCTRYGRALFGNRLLASIVNGARIPFYLWIRMGCCMDMMSNPGFVRDPEQSDEICSAMAEYLGRHSVLTIVYDYDRHAALYPNAKLMKSLPHALIDTSSMTDISDYTGVYKNIRKKLRVFGNKGGVYELVPNLLQTDDLEALKKCFVATAENSVFYLPYQDLYLESAINSSTYPKDEVYYFIARVDNEFIGYQAAVKTGSHLNALHGAFDRTRKTTFHAYDILYVKMTEFAIEHNLRSIDFGSVINSTKQRMVNKVINMSYFVYSKYPIVLKLFGWLLRWTKIQGRDQMKFRDEGNTP